jgi:hypothetical protein
MENLESLNTDDISNKIVEKDKSIISQMDRLDELMTEKHNLEVSLMNLNETIRMAKKLISKTKIEKDMLERSYWKARNR